MQLLTQILGNEIASKYLQNYPFLQDFECQKWLEALIIHNRGKNGFSMESFRAAISRFNAYLKFTKMKPKQLINECEKDKNLPLRKQRNPAGQRLKAFYDNLLKTKAPKTAESQTNSIRGFYKHNGFRIDVYVPQGEEIKVKRPLDKELIQQVLLNTSKLRDKLIILILTSSGMSITDVLDLRYRHIAEELMTNHLPLKIEFHRTKNNSKYVTFLSSECVNVLKQYLKSRNDLQPNDFLFLDSLNKHLSYRAFMEVIARISKATVGDRSINTKSFRRFFNTSMKSAGVSSDLVEYMMGHDTGVQEKYIDPEKLREVYKKVEDCVSIFVTVKQQTINEVKEINKEVVSAIQLLAQEFLPKESMQYEEPMDINDISKSQNQNALKLQEIVEKLVKMIQ